MHKYSLSYNQIEAHGLHEVLLKYQNRNHEELVLDFERLASTLLLNRRVVAVSSGTAALHLALATLAIGPGDLVAVPTFAYVAAVNPILYTGARPVWIDAEALTWNLCPDLLARALKKYNAKTKRIKAIIVVHNYGVPANMQAIMTVARHYRVPVIEDAAEAWGASVAGTPCGCVGDLGVFSFNSNKTVTAFGGGLLTTANLKWEKRARLLAAQARLPKPFYLFDEAGFNYRMSPLLAAYGLSQLDQHEQRVAQRQQIFSRYCDTLAQYPHVGWAHTVEGDVASRWLSAFRFGRPSKSRRIYQRLEERGFEVRRGWNPLHTMKHLSAFPAVKSGVSEQLFQEVICVPSGPGFDACIEALKELV